MTTELDPHRVRPCGCYADAPMGHTCASGGRPFSEAPVRCQGRLVGPPKGARCATRTLDPSGYCKKHRAQASDGGKADVPTVLFVALGVAVVLAVAGYIGYAFAWEANAQKDCAREGKIAVETIGGWAEYTCIEGEVR
jgi:hypothetical protein